MTKEEIVNKLKEELKANGLPIAEDAIQILVKVIKNVTIEAVQKSENKFDDIALPIINMAFEMLEEKVDLIDGVQEKKP